MKDEFKGKINDEFVGLKSQMYSLFKVDNEENKIAKGVNSIVVENIKHKEYLDALFNKNVVRHVTERIQSKLDRIGTYVFVKFLCLVLMIKYTYQMMVLIAWPIFIKIQEVNKTR